MSGNLNQSEERDERLLRRARAARAAGDVTAEREAITRLIEPYWNWGRSIAYGKIGGVDDPAADAEEIAQDLLRRLAQLLRTKLEFDTSFRGVAAANLNFAIKDYWRRSARTRSKPVDPGELVAIDPRPPVPSAGETAADLDSYFAGLSDRDRALAHDRLVLDLSPSEIAERHGMKRGAVDTAWHRIVKKMRENAPAGVRERDRGAV
jgi:RNA polymerase sigma factor (sigma-70 family)